MYVKNLFWKEIYKCIWAQMIAGVYWNKQKTSFLKEKQPSEILVIYSQILILYYAKNCDGIE